MNLYFIKYVNPSCIKRFKTLPFFLRVLITNVHAMGNNTAEYYKAGIHIILSDALVNVSLSTCDQTCMKDRLMDAREDGVWRGWQVM